MKILALYSEGRIEGKLHARVEIAVADSSELVTEIETVVFTEGSIAWDVSTGDFYGLAKGTWNIQEG